MTVLIILISLTKESEHFEHDCIHYFHQLKERARKILVYLSSPISQRSAKDLSMIITLIILNWQFNKRSARNFSIVIPINFTKECEVFEHLYPHYPHQLNKRSATNLSVTIFTY